MSLEQHWFGMHIGNCHIYARPRHLLMVSAEVDAILENRAGAREMRAVRLEMQRIGESLLAMQAVGHA